MNSLHHFWCWIGNYKDMMKIVEKRAEPQSNKWIEEARISTKWMDSILFEWFVFNSLFNYSFSSFPFLISARIAEEDQKTKIAIYASFIVSSQLFITEPWLISIHWYHSYLST